MQTGLQLSGVPAGTLHALWTGNIGVEGQDGDGVVLGNVNYADAGEVQMARDAILRMAAWSDLRKWAFQAGREDEGLAAIAQIILCTRAAIWARTNGREPAPRLTWNDAVAAQVKLFSVLSPRGLQAMTVGPEVVKDGIRYTPVTGNDEADQMLPMVVRPAVASALRALSSGRCEAADLLECHATAWHEDGELRQHATFLETESRMCVDKWEYVEAARLAEFAAKVWAGTDTSGIASAHAWGNAATSWRKVDQQDRAAQADLMAAALWETAGLPGEAAKAFRNAAWSLERAGKDDLAREIRVKAALAWESANIFALAAVAWSEIGSLERAPQAWKRALKDAGANTPASTAIAERGARFFYFELESETGAIE